MPNPGKPITFNGETMTVAAWARRLGIKRVTLQARIKRHGMSLERALSSTSLALKPSGNWYKVTQSDARDYEHRIVAQRALGRPLPPKAEVHHVDENLLNNDPSNLVICPNHGYHALLHMRARALQESGNANNLKCFYCKQWDAPGVMKKRIKNGAYHPKCHAEYHLAFRRNRISTKEE